MAALIDKYRAEGACDLMVVFSTDAPEESELAKRCAHHVELDDETAEKVIDHEAYLLKHGTIYYEVTANDPHRFIGDVSEAALKLGYVLMVFDEADVYVSRKADRRTLSLYPRGRKRGVNIVTGATSLKQDGELGVSAVAIRRSNVFVCFQIVEPNELKSIYERFPRAKGLIPDLATPRDDGAPEYVIRAEGGRELLKSRTNERDLRAPAL